MGVGWWEGGGVGEFISYFWGRLTKGMVFPRNVFYFNVLSGGSSPFAQTLHSGEVGFLCIHLVHVEPCHLYFLMYDPPHVPSLKISGGDPPNPPFVHAKLSPKISNFGSVYLKIGLWDFQSCSIWKKVTINVFSLGAIPKTNFETFKTGSKIQNFSKIIFAYKSRPENAIFLFRSFFRYLP